MGPAPLFAAASAVQAVGSLVGGSQQASQLNQQASAADANARLDDMQAGQAFAAGVQRESAQRRGAGQVLGEQRAAIAQSGFDANSGSALDIQLQSVRNAELDALQTRYEGVIQGVGYQNQANMDRYQAQVARASAKGVRRASYISAAANVLGGAAGYSKLSSAGAAASPLSLTVGGVPRLGTTFLSR